MIGEDAVEINKNTVGGEQVNLQKRENRIYLRLMGKEDHGKRSGLSVELTPMETQWLSTALSTILHT